MAFLFTLFSSQPSSGGKLRGSLLWESWMAPIGFTTLSNQSPVRATYPLGLGLRPKGEYETQMPLQPLSATLTEAKEERSYGQCRVTSHYPDPLQSFTGSPDEDSGTGFWLWAYAGLPVHFLCGLTVPRGSPSQKANARWFPQLQQLVKYLQEYVLFRNNSRTNTRLIKALISHTKKLYA